MEQFSWAHKRENRCIRDRRNVGDFLCLVMDGWFRREDRNVSFEAVATDNPG